MSAVLHRFFRVLKHVKNVYLWFLPVSMDAVLVIVAIDLKYIKFIFLNLM